MGCYGVFIGAGKAKIVFMINATCNLLRIPLSAYGMFEADDALTALGWAVGFIRPNRNDYKDVNHSQVTHGGHVLTINGGFEAVCWAIAFTSIIKACTFGCMLGWRHYSGTLFTDSSLIGQEVSDAAYASASAIGNAGEKDGSTDALLGSGQSPVEEGIKGNTESCRCCCIAIQEGGSSDEEYENNHDEYNDDGDDSTGLLMTTSVTDTFHRHRGRRSTRLKTIEEGDERARTRTASSEYL